MYHYNKAETIAIVKYFVIEEIMHNSLFELNDAELRRHAVKTGEVILERLKYKSPLNGWLVVCDELNNNANVIDRNEFALDIYLKFDGNDEFTRLSLLAVGTGVSFEEIVGSFKSAD